MLLVKFTRIHLNHGPCYHVNLSMGFINFTCTLFHLFKIVNITISKVTSTISKSARFVRIPVNFTKNIGSIYGSKLNKVRVSFVVNQVKVCSKQY